LNKIQKLAFRSVDDFLDYIPENELAIVEQLRKLILNDIPDCKEKLAYNIPFYYRHYRICYIWPASIPWGGIKEGVALGFCQANEMALEDDFLKFSEKKVIASRTFKSLKDINAAKITQLLNEAVIVDDELARLKKKKPTRRV